MTIPTAVNLKVFVVDVATKKIIKAVVVGDFISSESGYRLLQLVTDDGRLKSIEVKHCYTSKIEARNSLKRLKPLLEKINSIAKASKESMDSLRLDIIGNPEFYKLSQLIKKAK